MKEALVEKVDQMAKLADIGKQIKNTDVQEERQIVQNVDDQLCNGLIVCNQGLLEEKKESFSLLIR